MKSPKVAMPAIPAPVAAPPPVSSTGKQATDAADEQRRKLAAGYTYDKTILRPGSQLGAGYGSNTLGK